MAAQDNGGADHTPRRYSTDMLLAGLHRITDPPASFAEADRRRSRVLAGMLLTLTVLVFLTLILVLVTGGGSSERRDLYIILIAGLLLLLLIALRLNQSGHYKTAAQLTIACAVIGPWGAIALDQAILRGDFVPLVYVTVSVLLSSFLLSERATIALATLQFITLLLIPFVSPATASINWPSLLAFIFFTSALGVVSNFLSRRDLEQIDRQTVQLKKNEGVLRDASVHDSLTGLFNRRYLDEVLERELRQAILDQSPLSVMMLDVDHFKQYNDRYGHAAGDLSLRFLGDHLRGHIRRGDIACRYGGEEFVLVLPCASLKVTQKRAELLCESVQQLLMYREGESLTGITISVGVAAYPEHGSTSAALLGAADAALYRAKREGRNRVVVAK
jgi:diguanylate cyclase (GGDEF)-like protein